MTIVCFITHPDVRIDPSAPVPEWPLSGRGRARMHALLDKPWLSDLGAVGSSEERKAAA